MARVQGYTDDEVDILVADFEVVVQRAIQTACDAAAANLRPIEVLVAGSSTAHLGPDDVALITQVWQEQVDDVLKPYIAELYTGSATSVAVGMVDAFPAGELSGVPLVPDAFTSTYLTTASNRLVGVGDELWEDVRNELLDGVAAGESIPQLAARIESVAGFDTARASRIARTEVHGAAEAGSLAQVRYVGYDSDTAVKEWVATHDMRTRMSHSLADGQQVGLDDKFNVGGSLLDFPGDPSGPADEIIHCRCTTVFDLDVPPKFRCDGALVADAFHMPGQHDQKKHGGHRAAPHPAGTPLTDENRAALKSYSSLVGHIPINSRLRGRTELVPKADEADIDASIAAIQDGMRPLSSDTTVYRGAGIAGMPVSSVDDLPSLVGETLHDKGFTSTSTELSGKYVPGENDVLITIRVPAGYPTADMGDISSYTSETELLLDSGTTFKVTSVTPPGSIPRWQMELEVVT